MMKEDAAALSCLSKDLPTTQQKLFLLADTRRFFGIQGRLKRTMDVVLSILILLLTSPILGLLALLVKWTSRGPVLFVQERLGKDGQPFRFYKFRTMEHNSGDAIHRQFVAMFINGDQRSRRQAGRDKTVYKLDNDPRVTRIGYWLRRTSLDELPQLFNVIKGDMSLVGPRPPIPYEIEHYQPEHFERMKVVPGLTGLWQVSGRSALPFEEMVRLDILYINTWSLWLDMRILLRTLPVVIQGTGY